MYGNSDSSKKVSVVVCTYNGEAFVQEQMNSIIAQTYPLYEILVFDDASTDNTVEKVKAIAGQFPNIKLAVNERNIGFTKNFEQAIKAASGDVIAIADQDDIWIDTKIEKMMNAWKEPHSLIYCDSTGFTDVLPDIIRPPRLRGFEGTDARKIFLINTISGHASIFKKELVPLVLPFSENAMYDWWIAVVAAYNGGVQHYHEVLVYHRSHSKNITVKALSKYRMVEQRDIYKRYLIKQCKQFETAANIPLPQRNFLIGFYTLMQESLVKKFHTPLFLFLFKNRHILFSYKKKKIGIISHLKHSYLRTFNPKWKENLAKMVEVELNNQNRILKA